MTRTWLLLALLLLPLRSPSRADWPGPEWPHYVGDATFYGPGFEGRPTASGETFRYDARTCAVDPFFYDDLVGKRVRVCSKRACIEVKVNDVCPECALNGVIVDLPDAAFAVLGDVEQGRVFVKVWVVR